MRIKLQPGAIMPKQATKNAACYDLYSMEDYDLYPGEWKKIATGVHFQLPYSMVATLSHRSGMNSKQGIQAYGRIDPDYRGEVFATLFNNSPDLVRIKKGDRIAQVEFHRCWFPSFEVVDSLTHTKREDGGHGSTGR